MLFYILFITGIHTVVESCWFLKCVKMVNLGVCVKQTRRFITGHGTEQWAVNCVLL